MSQTAVQRVPLDPIRMVAALGGWGYMYDNSGGADREYVGRVSGYTQGADDLAASGPHTPLYDRANALMGYADPSALQLAMTLMQTSPTFVPGQPTTLRQLFSGAVAGNVGLGSGYNATVPQQANNALWAVWAALDFSINLPAFSDPPPGARVLTTRLVAPGVGEAAQFFYLARADGGRLGNGATYLQGQVASDLHWPPPYPQATIDIYDDFGNDTQFHFGAAFGLDALIPKDFDAHSLSNLRLTLADRTDEFLHSGAFSAHAYNAALMFVERVIVIDDPILNACVTLTPSVGKAELQVTADLSCSTIALPTTPGTSGTQALDLEYPRGAQADYGSSDLDWPSDVRPQGLDTGAAASWWNFDQTNPDLAPYFRYDVHRQDYSGYQVSAWQGVTLPDPGFASGVFPPQGWLGPFTVPNPANPSQTGPWHLHPTGATIFGHIPHFPTMPDGAVVGDIIVTINYTGAVRPFFYVDVDGSSYQNPYAYERFIWDTLSDNGATYVLKLRDTPNIQPGDFDPGSIPGAIISAQQCIDDVRRVLSKNGDGAHPSVVRTMVTTRGYTNFVAHYDPSDPNNFLGYTFSENPVAESVSSVEIQRTWSAPPASPNVHIDLYGVDWGDQGGQTVSTVGQQLDFHGGQVAYYIGSLLPNMAAVETSATPVFTHTYRQPGTYEVIALVRAQKVDVEGVVQTQNFVMADMTSKTTLQAEDFQHHIVTVQPRVDVADAPPLPIINDLTGAARSQFIAYE